MPCAEGTLTQDEKTCWLVDLGLIPYRPACALQQQLVEARKTGSVPDVLLLCEHPHVITLGRNGKREHLRAGDRLLAQMSVEFHTTNRGGDITYHGPGQIVGYPILDLAGHRRDVRWYVAQLEEIMIRTSVDFGVTARRVEGRRGVWVDAPAGQEKLGALGVHLSRWVTSHGFAYNVATDLRYFDLIVPCGIGGAHAASLERALGRSVDPGTVRARMASHFAEVFERDLVQTTREKLNEFLTTAEDSRNHGDSVMV